LIIFFLDYLIGYLIGHFIVYSGLAKAAAGGDERTLFSSWRPRTAAPTIVPVQHDNYSFYIGTINGIIYFIDTQGQCKEVLSTDAALHCLLYHQSRDSIIVMTEGLNIGHFQADSITGELTELTKVYVIAFYHCYICTLFLFKIIV